MKKCATRIAFTMYSEVNFFHFLVTDSRLLVHVYIHVLTRCSLNHESDYKFEDFKCISIIHMSLNSNFNCFQWLKASFLSKCFVYRFSFTQNFTLYFVPSFLRKFINHISGQITAISMDDMENAMKSKDGMKSLTTNR